MDNNSEFIIECLKSDIEKKIGRTLQTPTDYNYLSARISSQCDESISAHTIMRVWGYISSHSKPSVGSLSILSRFLGFMDFQQYSLDVNIRKSDNSGFIETDTLTADILQPGDILSLTWKPDRKVSLEYGGDFMFKVIENENSKLHPGDEFRCLSFAKGIPFIAFMTKHDGSGNVNYIGGKDSGLTSITLQTSRNKRQ